MDQKGDDNKLFKKYAKVIQSNNLPPPRFGHTVNIVSKTSIVIFGGAISTPDNQASYTMTADLYLYNMPENNWKKLEVPNNNKPPHVRAAHASATVRENQVLFYGGSIGNGQYATDDLWFLDIKSQEEANWMLVPINGPTPGPRYGHSMIYIYPNLILFGGSSNIQNQKNVITNDVWIFPTDNTPFKWIKIETEKNYIVSARLYHTSCVYQKLNDESDSLILFGGRDSQNVSLQDLYLLTKVKEQGKEFYKWFGIKQNEILKPNEVQPISRHQHSSTVFGPFFFVIGGRSSHSQHTTVDVYSFLSNAWYRVGNVGLFRHTIWIYNNDSKANECELSLYIYGGFDSEHNPEINSKLYKIDIFNLFSSIDILKEELDNYIASLNRNNNKDNSVQMGKNNKHFELSNKVVVYNIPDEENNFGKLVKEISYGKLNEVDKKLTDNQGNQVSIESKPNNYNETLVNGFLELLPNPKEQDQY